MTGRPTKNDRFFEIPIELRDGVDEGGAEVIHSRARVLLAEALEPAPHRPVTWPPPVNGYPRSIGEIYARILFHGRALQGLQEILELSPQRMAARITAAPSPDAWIVDPYRSRWITDPLVLDGAFQMASLWCYEIRGIVSLPTYCARYRQYRPRFPEKGVTALMTPREVTTHRLVADFLFADPEGEIVATMSGFEAVMDHQLMSVFKPGQAYPAPTRPEGSAGLTESA
jgi:hypothetical protein